MINLSDVQSSGIFDYEIFLSADEADFAVSGKNKKGLLVAISGCEVLAWKNFLEKVLQATGFSLAEDTATIWVTPHGRFCFSEIARKMPVFHAIFFGLEPVRAGLHIEVAPYQPVKIGQRMFLFCDDLPSIQADQARKRLLWEALKSVFLKKE